MQQNMHTTQMKLDNGFKENISLLFKGLKKKMRELQQVLQFLIAKEFLKFQAL